MKIKFNLQKALNGHPLTTRSGAKVLSFKPSTNTAKSRFPYYVKTEDNSFYVNKDGCYYSDNNSTDDLFLYKEDKHEPKLGDLIEVRDYTADKWTKMIFMFTLHNLFYCVHKDINISEARVIRASPWRHMRPIQKETIEVTVKRNGKKIDPSVLSQETWDRIRNSE